MKKKNINIAIVGLGNIGSYLYSYLKAYKMEILKKTNVAPNIVFVLAKNKRKKRKLNIPKNIWLNKISDVYNNKKIDVVIELIGGSEGPAKKLVFESLKNKKHVVTANKALIAKYGDQLSSIAENNKVNLEFEAAVCGGVPIIRSIKEGLIANNIKKIQGIFNGTSNYILTSMDKYNISLQEALSNAKRLGYAESNPSSDLNGEDVASKLKILSALSFNSKINNNIHIEGIKNVDHLDIYNCNKLGYKIKLLATAEIKNNKIIQRVSPCLVKNNSYISSVDGILNAVIINGLPVGKSIFQGEGAGPAATTSALVSDISSILRGNIKYPFAISNKERENLSSDSIHNQEFSAYIRLDVLDKQGVLSNITSIFSKNKVSIKRLIQNPYKSKKYSSIIIITHKIKDIYLKKSIKILSNKNFLIKKPKLIRIENT